MCTFPTSSHIPAFYSNFFIYCYSLSVFCSTHGRSFTRPWYAQASVVQLIILKIKTKGCTYVFHSLIQSIRCYMHISPDVCRYLDHLHCYNDCSGLRIHTQKTPHQRRIRQAHVHKISFSKGGQWKRANRSVMINRNWTRDCFPSEFKITVEEDTCSSNWLRNAINDLAVMSCSEFVLPPPLPNDNSSSPHQLAF